MLETIQQTKAKLEAVRETFVSLGPEFEFAEPSEEDLTEVRAIYEKGVELES